MLIKVEMRPASYGMPEPVTFNIGNRHVVVSHVIDRWLAASHSYFKLEADDGGIYILRHDEQSDRWELTLFRAKMT